MASSKPDACRAPSNRSNTATPQSGNTCLGESSEVNGNSRDPTVAATINATALGCGTDRGGGCNPDFDIDEETKGFVGAAGLAIMVFQTDVWLLF